MDEELAGVVSNIRACVISSKGPVPIRNLIRDYETLVGSSIPYRKYNFSNLEAFLSSLPSLRITGSGRDTMVAAAQDRASSHISSLISRQKSTKKRVFPSARKGPPSRAYGRARGYTPKSYSERESAGPPRYPKYASNYQKDDLNSGESLVVKVDGSDRRQVSLEETSNAYNPPYSIQKESKPKYEIPPRLQKTQQNWESSVLTKPSTTSSVRELIKYTEENLYLDEPLITQELETMSSLGPSQRIAAGVTKPKMVHYDEQYVLQSPELDVRHPNIDSAISFDSATPFDSVTSFVQFNHLDSLESGNQGQYALVNEQGLNLTDEENVVNIVPKPDEINIKNNVKLLKQYVLSRGWNEPEFSVMKPKGQQYFATVKIYDHSGEIVKKVSGIQYADANPEVAKGYAARIVLEEFSEQEKVKPIKNISSDQNIICNRISEIVSGIYNGLFARNVEEIYTKNYTEGLPSNWIQIIRSCPTLSVVPNINDTIIHPIDPTKENVLNNQLPVVEPLALVPPPNDVWPVVVTYVTSPRQVWFRIIGDDYDVKFCELHHNMASYYQEIGTRELALSIEEGKYYAARSADEWFRVRVIEVNKEANEVLAWLIDFGDNDVFSFTCIYRLPSKFCTLQRQALQCTLTGLEDYSEDQYVCQIVGENLMSPGQHHPGSFIAHIDFMDLEAESIKATFYDTVDANDDVNVNEKLLQMLETNEKLKLPDEGRTVEVNIGHISKRGELYVQLGASPYNNDEKSTMVHRVMEVIASLTDEEIKKHKLTSYRQVVLNKIYLAKYSEDDQWYRAVVTATPSVQQNKIAVQYVDYGNTETVSITDIAEVEKLPRIISNLAPQAVKVALNNLPVESLSNVEIAKLHSLLLDEEKVILMRMVKPNEDPPIVDLFFKNDTNGMLESVNTTIEFQRILYRPQENESNLRSNSNSFANGQDTFNMGLRRPEFDDKGFTPIVILLAANPGNFIFRLDSFRKELVKLMIELQAYYEVTALPELPKDKIVKGGLYAVRHSDDKKWYRGYVTEAIIGLKVPVRLYDYGDMVCVSISELRELVPEFCRAPFMAVKGKLAGVVPIHTDWSVEDCIRFHNLVVKKKIMASVIDIEESFTNPLETVVSLKLVDTNSNSDVNISETLIKENRAVKVES